MLACLRFSKIFGVFPLRLSGTYPSKWFRCKYCTIWSAILIVTYSLAMSDFMYSTIERRPLSFVLTLLPFTISSVVTDASIRISSTRSCNDLIRFLELTAKYGKQHDRSFMGYFWSLLILFATTAVALFVGFGLIFPEIGVTASGLKLGPEWNRVLSFWNFFSYFMHDGSLLCALCFLIVFGRRAVSCFKFLCGEITEYCLRNLYLSSNTFQTLDKVQLPKASSLDEGDELIDKFLELKAAFGIYMKVGEIFTFALVTDIGTWIFFLACTVLFNDDTIKSGFLFTVTACQSLITVLMLITIAELGHQLRSKVNAVNAKNQEVSQNSKNKLMIFLTGGTAA